MSIGSQDEINRLHRRAVRDFCVTGMIMSGLLSAIDATFGGCPSESFAWLLAGMIFSLIMSHNSEV